MEDIVDSTNMPQIPQAKLAMADLRLDLRGGDDPGLSTYGKDHSQGLSAVVFQGTGRLYRSFLRSPHRTRPEWLGELSSRRVRGYYDQIMMPTRSPQEYSASMLRISNLTQEEYCSDLTALTQPLEPLDQDEPFGGLERTESISSDAEVVSTDGRYSHADKPELVWSGQTLLDDWVSRDLA